MHLLLLFACGSSGPLIYITTVASLQALMLRLLLASEIAGSFYNILLTARYSDRISTAEAPASPSRSSRGIIPCQGCRGDRGSLFEVECETYYSLSC